MQLENALVWCPWTKGKAWSNSGVNEKINVLIDRCKRYCEILDRQSDRHTKKEKRLSTNAYDKYDVLRFYDIRPTLNFNFVPKSLKKFSERMRNADYFTPIELTDDVIVGVDVNAMSREQYNLQKNSITCKRMRFWSNNAFILFRCTGMVVKTTLQGRGTIAYAFKVNTSNKNHKEMSAKLQSYIASCLLPKAKINVLTTDMKKRIKEIVNICKFFCCALEN